MEVTRPERASTARTRRIRADGPLASTVLFVAACAAVQACGTSGQGTDSCGHVKTEDRAIVNGVSEPDPEVVDLDEGRIRAIGMVETDLGRCTGTIVSWDVVLTAAHCLEGWLEELEFVVGDQAIYGAPSLRVASYHIHPDYAWPDNDVAVLILDQDPATLGIVPIPVDMDPPPVLGERVQSVGYGMTDPVDGWNETRLWTTQTVVDEDAVFYYAYDDGLTSTCYGDSGGPMLYQVPGEGVRVLGDLSALSGYSPCSGWSWYVRTDAIAGWLSTFVEYGPCGIEREIGRCDGGTAVWCEDGLVVSEDCAAGGLECGDDGSGRSRCVEACDGETVAGRCDGEVATWCEAGEPVSWDCTVFGYVCAEDASGNHRCVSECSALGPAGECDGDTARWCEGGTIESEACGELGLACGLGEDGRARCMEECDALGHAGECEGGVARWCDDGHIRERDCTACDTECGWAGEGLGWYCI